MKRAIKYLNRYESDKHQFSNLEMQYEVLPYIFDDNAGTDELNEVIEKLGLKKQGRVFQPKDKHRHRLPVTHACLIDEFVDFDTGLYLKGEVEKRQWKIGLIKFEPVDGLRISVKPYQKLPDTEVIEIMRDQKGGFDNYVTIGSTEHMVYESWDAFHYLPLSGYYRPGLNDLGEELKCESTFSDEISSCHECGEYMFNDNGRNYNFRIVEDCTLLGIECGCFETYQKNNINTFIGNTDTPMELDVAKELAESGKLKHLERFIGGMTDGRGGHYGGEFCAEGNPEEVLKKYQAKYPKQKFIFTHDESGQFQTYFSIWRVK